MEKNFNHAQLESQIYARWEESGLFAPKANSQGAPFVIVIPPPNVTGNLHMGHALDNTLQDILIRYHRMKGDDTLWVPGTDHAGIATQAVVEKALALEGIKREDLGREKFVARVWQWKAEYGGNIARQLRRLGASCDWGRERFTLDEGLSKAVREVFVRLYEEDLIYQGDYIINWCPRCLTALADIEVERDDRKDSLYHIHYPLEGGASSLDSLIVATTRPETMFGDTAVAVNPKDERYKTLIGRLARIPLIDRLVPIIADEYVDLEFGTGALKVTPGHDHNDFQIGQRHNLPIIKAIDERGFLTEAAGVYKGLERDQARQKVVLDLESQGLLAKIEPIAHAVGVCYRCRTVIEPLVSRQWFVRATPLAKKAIEAVRDGRTRLRPAQWEKTYFEWLENIRDWCVSRQLWWGHRIPAWSCSSCGKVTVSREDPASCPHCQGQLRQDPDVLDTWFSSGLWPFSTLGWPEKTADLARFYPTTVLVTGFDIIFFWVARMMMMGLWLTDQAPFRDVVLHPLVRDAHGQKMSKSKGNVIDPIGIIDLYGTDAFRFTLAAQAGQNRDMKLNPARVAGYGKFINKIWNAARFVLTNLGGEDYGALGDKTDGASTPALSLPDRWIHSRLLAVTAQCRERLENFEFDHLADVIYHFVWDEFCDWYLELVKPILYGADQTAIKATRRNLLISLVKVISLAHPIIPFVTEEIWGKIPGAQGFLMNASYPEATEDLDPEAESQIGILMDIARVVRSIRADFGAPPGAKVAPLVKTGDPEVLSLLANYGPILTRLMGAESLKAVEPSAQKPRDAAGATRVWGEIWVPLGGHIDLALELARLDKEAAQLAKDIRQATGKLHNPDYVQKAPSEVVEETRERLDEMTKRAAVISQTLTALKEMAQ
ncbi:MAG: valine--tRNA ligase [Deltaproteobacteria bacterium]|jgi:valyl-tRNA synthetase|nr:valine--tRNA ligase [Deltaproteobacteria bacterium]